MSLSERVKGTLLAAGVVFWAAAAGARSSPPLYDPVSLNIGLSCQWQHPCIVEQTKAMKRALKYVKNKRPPSWQIQTCNRNASRKRFRVDWVGFNNCIRNAAVRPNPPRSVRKRVRGLTESSARPASSPPPSSEAKGERGD